MSLGYNQQEILHLELITGYFLHSVLGFKKKSAWGSTRPFSCHKTIKAPWPFSHPNNKSNKHYSDIPKTHGLTKEDEGCGG